MRRPAQTPIFVRGAIWMAALATLSIIPLAILCAVRSMTLAGASS